MPNFDKTGPAGTGAKTGGQMGKCADAKPEKRPFNGQGKGIGRGCGKSAKNLRGCSGRRASNT